MKPLIPPNFVNVSSGDVYDADLPDPLFRTYVRLRGLAWQSKYRETPPLTIAEAAAICHHSVRSMWGHLSELRQRGRITWHPVGQGRIVISFPLQNFAVPSLQNFAVPINNAGGVVVDPDSEQQQQPAAASLQNFAVVQNFAVSERDERVEAVVAALARYGVSTSEPSAVEVAALDHVTPELVCAWGEYLAELPGVRNPPGLLLYKLRTTRHPPRTDERRGGARSPARAAKAETKIPEPRSPLPLPDALRGQLDRLGLVGDGPRREVAEAWAEEPERVQGWVDYVLREQELGPGFLLTMIRSGEPAPGRETDNRQRYIGGEYADLIQH